MSKKIKAVIFDMDGTILDSRELIFTAFEDVLSSRGIQISRTEIGAVTGRPVQAMYKMLAPNLDAAEMELEHLAHHEDNLHTLKAYDQTKQLIDELRKRDLKIGIFTGFDQLTYDRLKQVGLDGLFDSVVESTRYTAHKPDPEGMYICMEDMGISDPAEVLYVGDGVADIEVGKNARVRSVVGITHGFCSRETLEGAGADFVIDKLSAIPSILDKLEKDDA